MFTVYNLRCCEANSSLRASTSLSVGLRAPRDFAGRNSKAYSSSTGRTVSSSASSNPHLCAPIVMRTLRETCEAIWHSDLSFAVASISAERSSSALSRPICIQTLVVDPTLRVRCQNAARNVETETNRYGWQADARDHPSVRPHSWLPAGTNPTSTRARLRAVDERWIRAVRMSASGRTRASNSSCLTLRSVSISHSRDLAATRLTTTRDSIEATPEDNPREIR